MVAYCQVQDLVLGNVPVPASGAKYVQDAADEMDSRLGLVYVTPLVLNESIPAQRPASLLLKRINAWLASGRLVLALDAAGEDDQLHQYGQRLVDEALKALDQIVDGSILMPGGEPINPEVNRVTGPVAAWADDTSPVEAFQTVFGNPAAQALTASEYLPLRGGRSPYTY